MRNCCININIIHKITMDEICNQCDHSCHCGSSECGVCNCEECKCKNSTVEENES